MNEIFIKSIYETLVKENKQIYKQLFNETVVDKRTTEYWKQALSLYNSLSHENKEVLLDIIEQITIDTTSNILGIIDGSSTLNNCNIEPKLFLDNNDTNGELQDLFLEYVEDNER